MAGPDIADKLFGLVRVQHQVVEFTASHQLLHLLSIGQVVVISSQAHHCCGMQSYVIRVRSRGSVHSPGECVYNRWWYWRSSALTMVSQWVWQPVAQVCAEARESQFACQMLWDDCIKCWTKVKEQHKCVLLLQVSRLRWRMEQMAWFKCALPLLCDSLWFFTIVHISSDIQLVVVCCTLFEYFPVCPLRTSPCKIHMLVKMREDWFHVCLVKITSNN